MTLFIRSLLGGAYLGGAYMGGAYLEQDMPRRLNLYSGTDYQVEASPFIDFRKPTGL